MALSKTHAKKIASAINSLVVANRFKMAINNRIGQFASYNDEQIAECFKSWTQACIEAQKELEALGIPKI